MTDHPGRVPAPDLAPGDLYVHAHTNGAVFVLEPDGRSGLAPLDDVLAKAEACHAAGRRVRFGRQPRALADDVARRLQERGIRLDVVDDALAPHVWD